MGHTTRFTSLKWCLITVALMGSLIGGWSGTESALAATGGSCLIADGGTDEIASDKGKFKFTADPMTITVGGTTFAIDASSKLEIYNGNKRVSLDSLAELGNLLDAKATVICSQSRPADGGTPVILTAIVHIYS